MDRILAEEQKREREAKLEQIMREQKEQLKKTIGGDSDDDDSDFDDDSDEEVKDSKPKAKPVAAKVGGKSNEKSGAMDYFMKKAGKDVSESSDISITDEEEDPPIPVVETS